jgi:N-acetylglutamate synthase
VIKYRPMKIEDYEGSYALWKNLEGLGLSSADSFEAINVFLDRNPAYSHVAMDGDVIVGTVLCGHDGRRGYLHHLAVAKNHQKSGIGKNLFKLCFEKLAEVGIKKSHIFVVADNENAIQFWKKNGWEHRDYLIIMSKQVE